MSYYQYEYGWTQPGAPGWQNCPVPGWCVNPLAAGPRMIAIGEDESPEDDDTVSTGAALLVGSGALLVGIFLGWMAGKDAPRAYRLNPSRPPVGSGQRFRQLESRLRRRRGVHDPRALAAHIGRRKYGTARYQAMAAAGRRRAVRARAA